MPQSADAPIIRTRQAWAIALYRRYNWEGAFRELAGWCPMRYRRYLADCTFSELARMWAFRRAISEESIDTVKNKSASS